jgi:nucleoid-associated protein YgaU
LIVAGRTYVIPAISKGAVAIAPPPKSSEAPSVEPTTVEKTIWYVVQPHDTLWSIAMNEVGTPSAVAAIEDLNKNTLNGNEALRPNMKLKLPKKAE